MIQANGLRIGNLLLVETAQSNSYFTSVKNIHYKLGFSIHKIQEKGVVVRIKPIKITKEILIKIGYKQMPSGIYIQENSGNFIWFESNLKCIIAGEFYPKKIKYLHQLQNLYFALTQTELEINL